MNFLIIVRILLSWVPNALPFGLVSFLKDVTDPVLNLAKKVIPPMGVLDLSPMVAIIALNILQGLLLQLLSAFAV